MTKAKIRAATVGGTADDIEAAFYDALRSGDAARLMACWADEDEVVCVHPGGDRLLGPGEIRASFEAMLAQGALDVVADQVRKCESMASAVHSVRQRIALQTSDGPREAVVLATNVYHKTAQGWRMVAHHASPGTLSAPDAWQHGSVDGEPVLH